jgi:hypothetical protein
VVVEKPNANVAILFFEALARATTVTLCKSERMDSEDSLSISNDEYEGSFDEGSSDESESESSEVTSKKQYQSHKRVSLTQQDTFWRL